MSPESGQRFSYTFKKQNLISATYCPHILSKLFAFTDLEKPAAFLLYCTFSTFYIKKPPWERNSLLKIQKTTKTGALEKEETDGRRVFVWGVEGGERSRDESVHLEIWKVLSFTGWEALLSPFHR